MMFVLNLFPVLHFQSPVPPDVFLKFEFQNDRSKNVRAAGGTKFAYTAACCYRTNIANALRDAIEASNVYRNL